ncbi:sialic acid-binding Ig-like lectin 11 isoform X3 [Bubalus bubalis]|uniref:sialic acid-binding Ig-like lectin 11 isoform X3 n=1 Tax=Bubalus bubalis TaxID=89462 RepID=UPI001E1B847D|nr:sialic acid-binding Ig-like lectin 11 isoform X3 [Bubalus bubalis]
MVTLPVLLELPSRTEKQLRNWTALGTPGPLDMERLLLLPLLWAGSLEKESLYQLQVQGSVTVQEGLCVSVPCNVSYPQLGWAKSTRVYGAWFRKEDRLHEDVLVATDNSARGGKKKRNISFHLLGDPRANNCSLGIAEARKRDSGNYYFQLIREAAEHSYKNNQLTVNVIGSRDEPHLSGNLPQGFCERGEDRHTQCVLSSPEADHQCLRRNWHRAETPGERLISSCSGRRLSAPGLQHRQQPPGHTELVPGEPDPEPLTSFKPWGPVPAPSGVGPRRRTHLPSSAPSGLPVDLRASLCADTPAAAGPLLLPGGRGSALQLLLPSPTSPLSALAAGRGAAGGGAQQHQQRLLRGRLQLRRALDQWLPEPPRGAQLRPQPQLRGPERPRGPERVCPAAAREAQAWRGIFSGGHWGSWRRWPAQSLLLPHLLQGYQDECPSGSPLDYPPPAVAAPLSGEDQELHYASLSFLELRPWEPRDQAATSTTEYAEVKILNDDPASRPRLPQPSAPCGWGTWGFSGKRDIRDDA